MKKKITNHKTIILFLIFSTSFINIGYGKDKMEKIIEKVKEYETKGCIAAFGLGVSSNFTFGLEKAKADARANIVEIKGKLISDFIKELCNKLNQDECDELKKYFGSSGIISGTLVIEQGQFQTKENKKQKVFTYYVIMVISPKVISNEIEAKLKKVENENLYEIYQQSAFKKELEEMTEKYAENFK